jgi:hypothetical protein
MPAAIITESSNIVMYVCVFFFLEIPLLINLSLMILVVYAKKQNLCSDTSRISLFYFIYSSNNLEIRLAYTLTAFCVVLWSCLNQGSRPLTLPPTLFW